MGYRKFSEIIGDIGPERRARIDALKEAHRRQPQSGQEAGWPDAAAAAVIADDPR